MVISGNTTGIYVHGPNATGIRIEGNYIGTDIDGVDALPNETGVRIEDASGVVIGGTAHGTGNVISGNLGSSVLISGANSTGNQLVGNYIGTDATGTENIGNGGWNVVVQGASGNQIGGDSPESGNVIAGGGGYGVIILGATATGNSVQNNLIGTDASGMLAFSNGIGVSIQDAEGNTVDSNLISGNDQHGVYVSGPTGTGNRFVNNSIGVAADGTTSLSNGIGMYFQSASNNVIGEPGQGNVIAYNGGGVFIVGATAIGNSIRGNSIRANSNLGIDLGADGVTPNDDGDASVVPPVLPDEDRGPNELQNAPDITSAVLGNTTRVSGQLRSTPNSTFIIDFYASSSAGPLGSGEGERWLGSIAVTTSDDKFGTAGFSTEIASAVVGEYITATATNINGSTSEFSNTRVVRRPTGYRWRWRKSWWRWRKSRRTSEPNIGIRFAWFRQWKTLRRRIRIHCCWRPCPSSS